MEGKVEFCLVVLVGLYRGWIDGQDSRVRCIKLGPVITQGLQLTVSTRGVVAAVEYQEDVLFALETAEGNVLTVGVRQGEIGCGISDGKRHARTSLGVILAPV